MESSFLTRDQALSLWSGSTDSKTLDYQKNNPRNYQIVRTHTKENHLNTRHHPTTSSNLCRKPHVNNKQNKIQSQSSADRITSSPSLTHQRKKKQTSKQQQQQKSVQISPYTNLTQTTGPTLGGKKPKKKDFSLEAWEKETSNTISWKKENADKYYMNEGTN